MIAQNVTTFQQVEKAVLSKATEINVANGIALSVRTASSFLRVHPCVELQKAGIYPC